MAASQHVSTLRDYLQVVRRRKWIIVQAAVIVPVAALAFSLHQQAMYQGSSQVLLSQQDLANQITGTQVSSYNDPADRQAQTQAALARVPAVAARVIHRLGLRMTPNEFLASSSVSAGANQDTLSFAVTNHDPALASRMATAYARAYVAYRLQVETTPLEQAKRGLEERLAATPKGSALYNSLVEKEQTLDELEALKTSDASVINDGGQAVQTAPKTARNTVLGVILGLFLGVGLAFLREALDTRVRSAGAIADRLELPLLARLPAPPRKLRDGARLVMLGEPKGVQAEAFRVLRTNIEFAALGKDVRTLMVTSAVEKEGKSTTIANLAVALARAGQRVVLVDLDLRRPFVDRFFDLGGRAGVTQVAIGHVDLDEALVPVTMSAPQTIELKLGSAITGSGQIKILGTNGNGSGNGNGRVAAGSLQVLPAGPIPPDPGEFVGSARLTEILEQLRDRADVVLIDAPPLFHVGDALALSPKVDAAIVVTRMDVVRRPMLAELKRVLDSMPTTLLGFVVTGAEAEDSYGYDAYYHRPYASQLEDEVRA